MRNPANVGAGASMAAIFGALPVVFLGYGFGLVLYPFAVIVTSLHTVLVGVPLYYLLRRRFEIGWIISAISGLAIGLAPMLSLTLLWSEPEIGVMAFAAGSGALGGLAFRWGLAWQSPPESQ